MQHSDAPAHCKSILRLMQLVSPGLPVGAYAYSHGLEYAVHAGWVNDEASTADWVLGIMNHSLCLLDVPVLMRLYRAWQVSSHDSVHYWNNFLYASRESDELQEEDHHLGTALARLLAELEMPDAKPWLTNSRASFATLFALAAVRWEISLSEAANGYLWSWTENQVITAIKLLPLGQTAGQRVLSEAVKKIPDAVERGFQVKDNEIGFLAPGLGIASSLHETQYSRLFCS